MLRCESTNLFRIIWLRGDLKYNSKPPFRQLKLKWTYLQTLSTKWKDSIYPFIGSVYVNKMVYLRKSISAVINLFLYEGGWEIHFKKQEISLGYKRNAVNWPIAFEYSEKNKKNSATPLHSNRWQQSNYKLVISQKARNAENVFKTWQNCPDNFSPFKKGISMTICR